MSTEIILEMLQVIVEQKTLSRCVLQYCNLGSMKHFKKCEHLLNVVNNTIKYLSSNSLLIVKNNLEEILSH